VNLPKPSVLFSGLLAAATLLLPLRAEASAPHPASPEKTPQAAPQEETRTAIDRADGVTPGKPVLTDKGLASPLQIQPTDAEDGRIGQIVSQILERAHYLQKPLDDTMSALFLKMYIDALDYRHMVFLQSDIDEFSRKYGFSLGAITLSGDITPERDIFSRFLARLKERSAQVDEILRTPPDFTQDESFLADRSKAPWPKTAEEAANLWRLQVKYELLAAQLGKEKADHTAKTIAQRYHRMVKTMQDMDHEEMLGTYLTSLTRAYDPHSDYFTAEDAENFSINSIKMKLTGIGAVLKTEDGYPAIVSLVPGGPADLDGHLKPSDRLTAIAQEGEKPVDVVDMNLNKVVNMIRGKRGTKVTLTVIPAAGGAAAPRHDVVLTRDEVNLTQQKAQARIYERQTAQGVQRYGVLILPTFYDTAAEDTAKLIKRMEKENIQGLILDLRRNGGGILEQAVDLVGLFVPHGPVVQVKNPQGTVKSFSISGDNVVYTGPLLVMVGKSSASASEIVAAALQDYGRALIVGDKTTFGKGTVQTLIALKEINLGFHGDPGELKLTIQKFYRINGATTQNQGVASDITIPSIDDYTPYGESLLPNAMPADSVKPADYQRSAPVFPGIAALQARSAERIAKSPEFAYLNEEIASVKQRVEDKTVSLNEAKRRAELDRFNALKAKRDKMLTALPVSAHKVYTLDLDMLDKNQPPKLVTQAVPAVKKAKNPVTGADDDGDEDADEAAPPPGSLPRDVRLDEAINLLGDYMALLAGHTPVAVQPTR
jgi:carboxyl-terminal processing protease